MYFRNVRVKNMKLKMILERNMKKMEKNNLNKMTHLMIIIQILNPIWIIVINNNK